MRQKIFLLFGFFCSFIPLFAQRDTAYYNNKYKWEVGLNVTSVITSFVGNKSEDVLSPGSYQLYAKAIVNSKQSGAIRLGLGGSYSQNKRLNTSQSFLTDYSKAVSARVGYEWRNYIARRWMVFYGADLLGQLSSKSISTTTTIDVVNRANNTLSAGLGPHLGFQFALHKRIHIGTESAIYGFFQNDSEKISFMLNPNLNTKTQSQGGNVSFSAPKWIYLIVRF